MYTVIYSRNNFTRNKAASCIISPDLINDATAPAK
jgi:hypothetical protein